jgi:V-type H+-transporting ATPase subunit a
MSVFERIMFRALRGNLYLNYAEIQEPIIDPSTEAPVDKNVFIIFAHGKELLGKIRKICESMNATLYPVDDSREKRRDNALEVLSRIEDLNHVLENTVSAKRNEILTVADQLELWASIIKKEKATYHAMNLFNYDVNRKALIAEAWCPTNSLNAVNYCLRTVTERTNSTIPPLLNEVRTSREPPTYHRTNSFTNGFQEIVDSYGIATYREVNPGLFTTITFPFLFAVMFGDLGHGFIVTLFAAWMCYNEKTLKTKKWGEVFLLFWN